MFDMQVTKIRAVILFLATVGIFPSPSLDGSILRDGEAVKLRGLGEVRVTKREMIDKEKDSVAIVEFTAQSEELAAALASKFLADFDGYSLQESPPAMEGVNASVRCVVGAGVWLVGLNGNEMIVMQSSSADALRASAMDLDAATWKIPQERIHPRYLDTFDNDSFAFWWVPGRKSEEILQWASDYPAIINTNVGSNLSYVFAPQVTDLSLWDDVFSHAQRINRPARVMLYSMDPPAWFGTSENSWQHMERAEDGERFGLWLQRARGFQALQTASPDMRALLAESMLQIMDRVPPDKTTGWMVPPGEWNIKDPFLLPPGWETSWPAFLRDVKGYSVEDANSAYGINVSRLEDVPFFGSSYFAGRRGDYFPLDQVAWRWRAGVSKKEGMEAGMHTEDFDDQHWLSAMRNDIRTTGIFQMTGKRTQLQEGEESNTAPTWIRFVADVPPEFVSRNQPVYLVAMPYTQGAGRPLSLFLNGEEVPGEMQTRSIVNRVTYFDLTGRLQPGRNRFVFHSNGGRIHGPVWLGRHAPETDFPFSDARLSRSFVDTYDYLHAEKLKNIDFWIRTIRSKDSEKPIKFMQGEEWITELQDFGTRHGAYVHNTGQTDWYRPFHYKGYARLRGLPTSGEPGASARTSRHLQNMTGNLFWEGQDALDYVFNIQRDVWPKKDVVKWFEDHRNYIQTLGKTDFPDARTGIGELRDTHQLRKYGREEILFGLSRFLFPSAGITPAMVDGRDFDLGAGKVLPILFDNSTRVATERRVKAILDYVNSGGTFIASFNTATHSETERDIWPLARSIGFRVREIPENAPELFRVEPGCKLFPRLAGKSFKGFGVAFQQEAGKSPSDLNVLARWQDGSIAAFDLRVGHGRLIWLGTPIFSELTPDAGRGVPLSQRVDFLRDFLSSLGVKIAGLASDPAIWVDRRESKNGLYDVFFAAVMTPPKGWNVSDTITATLRLFGASRNTAVDLTESEPQQFSGKLEGDELRLENVDFKPYIVRQFAVVREHVGIDAPLHWLGKLSRTWPALEPVPDAERFLSEQKEQAAGVAERLRQAAIGLNDEWMALPLKETSMPGNAWITGPVDGPGWQKARLGTWRAEGWPSDIQMAIYRKDVEVPADWLSGNGTISLLFSTHGEELLASAQDSLITLWINGNEYPIPAKKSALIDVDAELKASGGKAKLAVQIMGENCSDPGFGGVLSLWYHPKRSDTLSLNGEWRRILWFDRDGPSVTVPGLVQGKETAVSAEVNEKADRWTIGIVREFELPEDWNGQEVRIKIDQAYENHRNAATTVLVNGNGYFNDLSSLNSTGVRIDYWLKPGTNRIELYNNEHRSRSGTHGRLNTNIGSVILEKITKK